MYIIAFQGYKKNNPARRAGEKNNLAPKLSEKNFLARKKIPSPPQNIKWTVPYNEGKWRAGLVPPGSVGGTSPAPISSHYTIACGGVPPHTHLVQVRSTSGYS